MSVYDAWISDIGTSKSLNYRIHRNLLSLVRNVVAIRTNVATVYSADTCRGTSTAVITPIGVGKVRVNDGERGFFSQAILRGWLFLTR